MTVPICQHQVIALGADLMELRDNADGSLIATATRTDPTAEWAITIERGPETFTATSRTDAYMAMLNNGPAGVSDGTAGFSTYVPHGLDDLA